MSTLKVNKLRDTAGSTDAIVLDPSGGAVLAGVTTVSAVKVGSGVTISSDGDVFTTGITTSSTVIVGSGVTISESGIEASGIGITCANINGTQIGGRRNIIINGAMQVAQRATSHSGNGYATIDRMKPMNGGGAITQEQVDISSSDTPYTLGFRKALKVTNATAAADAGDYRDIRYNVEAQDIANSGFNSGSTSSKITFSFWAKSSVAMTYYYFIYVPDSDKHYVASFALSANTWTKVIKTIPGASGLSVNNDNGNGFNIQIAQHYGGNFTTSGQALDTWGTWSGSSRVPDMAGTWASTTNATFELTGLQLEVGSQATAFEHRSHSEELELCKRYYEQFDSNGLAEAPFGVGYFEANNNLRAVVPFQVEKRADVSFSSTAASTFASMNTNNMPAGSSISLYKTGKKAAILSLVLSSDVTSGDGRAGILCAQSSTEATLKFDSEL